LIKHAGIIAAGLGSRLPGVVKPLVTVAGKPLCHWIVASLRRAGVERFTLLHNSAGWEVRRSLQAAYPEVRWTFLQADTASSWESFRLVSSAMAGCAPSFLLSTADALVPPAEAVSFAQKAAASDAAAGLALTSFVDDEKPLYADIDAAGIVTALGEKCVRKQYVTCGLYHMTTPVAKNMPEGHKFPSLRRYLASLVDAGTKVAGFPLSKTLDVDRPEDVAQAEGFLKEAAASW
jgi:NDP-sugar pyrophosphorylase family protein